MTSYSKLLLAEEVLPPGDQPSYGKLSDLNMLISPGGQERTEADTVHSMPRRASR